ncbi:nucleoside hydrolase [Halocatena marina]|uniref:Nucleoside hydrolase n=1 Tax=Halocatena marina TaxID=2934937 RepID=A0ABD5YJI6_9EURY
MNTKLLLDVDPGNDDAIALFIALAADDIDLIGVTTVAGNTTVDNATENTLSLLELVDRADVPVVKGADRPLVDELVMAEHIHGPNGLPETVRETLPAPTQEPVDQHAVDFILEQASEYGEELTIAALGPQTNIALALAKEPNLPEMVGDIYQMGGALKTTGNVTPQASFNFYVDAVAAARVVQNARPKIVGLDVTEHVYVDTEDILALAEEPTPLPTMAAILEFSIEEVRSKFGHDGGLASDAVVLLISSPTRSNLRKRTSKSTHRVVLRTAQRFTMSMMSTKSRRTVRWHSMWMGMRINGRLLRIFYCFVTEGVCFRLRGAAIAAFSGSFTN